MSSASCRSARLVLVRLLGGRGYWPYGLEQVAACCAERGIALACLPGDERADPELTRALDPAARGATSAWAAICRMAASTMPSRRCATPPR